MGSNFTFSSSLRRRNLFLATCLTYLVYALAPYSDYATSLASDYKDVYQCHINIPLTIRIQRRSLAKTGRNGKSI